MARPSPRFVLIVLLLIVAPGVVPPFNAGSATDPLARSESALAARPPALPQTPNPTTTPANASPTAIATLPPPTPAPTLTPIPDTDYVDQGIAAARDALAAQVNALPALVAQAPARS
jgi:hypothetical protein